MTFLTGQQTDRPITHRVMIRWLDWLDERYVIIRRSLRPDQSARDEVFRIRKIGEVEGRKRFMELLVEQESRAALSTTTQYPADTFLADPQTGGPVASPDGFTSAP